MAADTVRAELDHYKHFEGRDLSDDQYFSILVFVAFYSGFRAATVTSKKKIIEGHFPGWKQVALYTESDIIKILALHGIEWVNSWPRSPKMRMDTGFAGFP